MCKHFQAFRWSNETALRHWTEKSYQPEHTMLHPDSSWESGQVFKRSKYNCQTLSYPDATFEVINVLHNKTITDCSNFTKVNINGQHLKPCFIILLLLLIRRYSVHQRVDISFIYVDETCWRSFFPLNDHMDKRHSPVCDDRKRRSTSECSCQILLLSHLPAEHPATSSAKNLSASSVCVGRSWNPSRELSHCVVGNKLTARMRLQQRKWQLKQQQTWMVCNSALALSISVCTREKMRSIPAGQPVNEIKKSDVADKITIEGTMMGLLTEDKSVKQTIPLTQRILEGTTCQITFDY